MSIFNPKRVFNGTQDDVRDRTALLQRIQDLPPNGFLWPLVGARRSGKTWTLQALKSYLNQSEPRSAHYETNLAPLLDLNELKDSRYLLLDEPFFTDVGNARDAGKFLKWCKERHTDYATRVIVAMSPPEWKCLLSASKGMVHGFEKDLLYVEPLSQEEARKVARKTPWAEQLLQDPNLPEGWAANPHLLECLFLLADRMKLEDQGVTPKLIRALLKQCAGDEAVDYFSTVFVNGLDAEQRRLIRAVARGKPTELGSDEVLVKCGLLKREEGRCVVADPVLRALVTPLRIHHLSDIHVGPKSARHGDNKQPGTHGTRMAEAAGVGLARENYIGHLKEMSACSEAPHLIIISGDVVETGEKEQFRQAREWVDSLKPLIGEHPLMNEGEERILLVGGNHDVDWTAAGEPNGARLRHQAFKEHFQGFLHPRLDEPPEAREAAVARYPDLGLAISLLGSSELGGEHEQAAEGEVATAMVMRIDPGLVHKADLERVKRAVAGYPVRIAVLHHPVSPLPGVEIAKFSGLINAGDVKEVLMREKVSLVLHGHAHKGWFGKEQWPGEHDWTLRIAAAPSLASKEVQEQHGFNQIEVSRLREKGPGEYLVTVQRYVFNGSSWVPDKKMSFRPGQPEDAA